MADPKRPHGQDDLEHEDTRSSLVGEASGGVSGGLLGAAIGAAGGPIGAVIGGIAGVVGGWWAGREISQAAEEFGSAEEQYRKHFDRIEGISSGVGYDQARVGYGVGHIASRNPDYRGRSFEEVEPEIRRGWAADAGDYDRVRDYIRHAYERGGEGRPER